MEELHNHAQSVEKNNSETVAYVKELNERTTKVADILSTIVDISSAIQFTQVCKTNIISTRLKPCERDLLATLRNITPVPHPTNPPRQPERIRKVPLVCFPYSTLL